MLVEIIVLVDLLMNNMNGITFSFNDEDIKGTDVPFVKEALSQAVEILQKRGTVSPISFVMGNNCMQMIQGHFSGETDEEINESKDRYSLAVKYLSLKHSADSVMFISEVWYVHNPTRSNAFIGNVQPKDHPEKREAIFASLETEDAKYMIRGDIIREEGKAPTVNRFDHVMTSKSGTGAKVTGRLTNFVLPKDIDPDLKASLLSQLEEQVGEDLKEIAIE